MTIFGIARKWLFRILQQLPTHQPFPKWKGFFFYAYFSIFAHSRTLEHLNARPEKLILRKLQQKGGDVLFSNNPYFQPNMPQGPAFQRPAFQQQPMMYQPQQMPVQQPMMQDGGVQVRFVASREEAVAASVIPGMPCFFVNRAQNEIYFKAIDPQTGMPEFRDYGEKQPEHAQAMQCVTPDALGAAMQELEQRFEQRIAALAAPRAASRKAVGNNDE